MFSWVAKTAQSTLASVAGTAEPIYGSEALQSVALQEHENPKYESTPDDLKWHALDVTCAETQTFYIQMPTDHCVMLQVVYSNIANLHISAQLNVKVFFPDGRIHWSAKTMENYAFDEQFRSFVADDFSIILSDDDTSYHIQSRLDPETTVDVTMRRTVPAFKVGKDGRTNYGDDPLNPWGFIQHVFWPRGVAEGWVEVKGERVDTTGKAIFVMALQGMKPHHAASKWNFATFESEHYAAIMMEFTTPPSYGSQTVNVATLWKDGELLVGSTQGTFEHTSSKFDPVSEWEEPTGIKVTFKGKSQDGKDTEAVLETAVERLDRVDIMAEVPAIVKRLLAGAVGTRPFMYQYRREVTMRVKEGDNVAEDKGLMFAEATFIS